MQPFHPTLRRRDLTAAAVLLAAGLPPARAQASRREPIDWARLLLEQVPAQSTSYVHGPGHVQWQEGGAAPQSHTDCSGLVNAMLVRSRGWTQDDLQKRVGRKRPVASTYFDAIQNQKTFERVPRVQDIRPGDLIVVRYEDGSPDTGHIMLVDAPAVPDATVAKSWRVRVIDSSRSGHGPGDTRETGPHRFRQGLGSGDLRLYAGDDGAITAYAWSTIAKSKVFPATERPIVVGRLMP